MALSLLFLSNLLDLKHLWRTPRHCDTNDLGSQDSVWTCSALISHELFQRRQRPWLEWNPLEHLQHQAFQKELSLSSGSSGDSITAWLTCCVPQSHILCQRKDFLTFITSCFYKFSSHMPPTTLFYYNPFKIIILRQQKLPVWSRAS